MLCKGLHCCQHSVVKTFGMTSAITGRGSIDKGWNCFGRSFKVFFEIADMSRNIFTNGFGQTSGGNTDYTRFILFDNVIDTGNKVFASAVHGCFFAEIT